jgi:hypothetical protein
MYLATVTCYRDFPQLLLQAESIQKFVEPCKHVIVVNHDNPDLDFYYRWLKPYYTKHELVIIPKIDYYYPVKGLHTSLVTIGTALEWRIQQLQKLLLAYEFEEDYLLLDSKNFFIKPTNLNYWENMIGSGKLTADQVNDYFSKTGDVYRKLFNVTDMQVCSPATPFKIDRELLTSRCKKEELGYFLYAPEFNERVVSEFIFYSVLINDEIKKCTYWPSKNTEGVLWQHDLADLHTRLMQTQNNPDIRISGFHRNLLGKVDTRQLSMINSWLKFAIGLNNTLHAMPLDPEMSAHDIKQLPKH